MTPMDLGPGKPAPWLPGSPLMFREREELVPPMTTTPAKRRRLGNRREAV